MTSSKTKAPKQTQFNTCMTGVNPIRTHGMGIWGNPRKVMGIRVDEKLKKEATVALKAIFGSTCRGIEPYLASIVAMYHNREIDGVYPSNTLSIGKIVIERNLRSRRKLLVPVEEVTETTEIKKVKRTKRKLLVNDLPDYSNFSLKNLERAHRVAQNLGNLGTSALIASEFKRRGVIKKPNLEVSR